MVAAAIRLAEWVGEGGIAVTPGGALRPAEVAGAARTLGVPAPAKVRRAADVAEVHRPWLVAVAAGLIAVEGKRAVQRGTPDDPLAVWRAGLRKLLDVEASDTFGTDTRVIALVTMDVLTDKRLIREWLMGQLVEATMRERGDWDHGKFQRHAHLHPAEAALAVLRLFGAIEENRLTPLGELVRAEWQQVVPPAITPETSAKELLSRLAGLDEVDARKRAWRWFGHQRTNRQIVDELVQAASTASPAERVAAIDLLSFFWDDLIPVLPSVERLPNLAAHLHVMSWQDEHVESLDSGHLVWLAAEYAQADLDTHGVTAARYAAQYYLDIAGIDLATDGIERIANSGHPYASQVAETLAPVAGSPVQVLQLKVSLHTQCWRRVLIPENATLAHLHEVIVALFGWDNDHLHIFTVGQREYADPFHQLEETVPEDAMRLHRAFPRPKTAISYIYDLGATWRHEIVLEKVLEDHPMEPPKCIAGKGDNPVEYDDPDFPQDPVLFDADAINRRLRKLGADE